YGTVDGNLGTTTSFTSNSLNLYCTSFHFWYFLPEKIFNESFIRTRENQLWTTVVALNILNKYFKSCHNTVVFALHLLAHRNNTAGFAKINPNDTRLNALHYTRNNGTNFIFVFGKHHFALGFSK